MNQDQQTLWQQDQVKITQILQLGLPSYLEAVVNLDNAFAPSPKTLRCIDERVNGNVALGGSGILLGLDQSAELFKNANLEAITSHQGCGAAGLYCQQHGIDSSQTDQTAIEFAKQLAAKLDVPYADHQPVTPSSHIARAIYYAGAETFNPRQVPQLPAGFTVSRCYHQNIQTALDEVALSIDIAFGVHGFGELFSQDQPLLIIAIPHPTNSAFNQTSLLQELNQLSHPQLNRVKILGWSAA